MTSRDKEKTAQPDAPSVVQADVVGNAVNLKPPTVSTVVQGQSHPSGVVPGTADADESLNTRDENQPGFIGERNRPQP